LYEDAVFGFKTCPVKTCPAESISEEWEYDHGRYEVRKCSILPSEKVLFPEIQEQWCGLKTTGNAPENLAALRKLALQIISKQQDKPSMKKRRFRAAYDTEYLKKLIS
jgi:hypothetical protein